MLLPLLCAVALCTSAQDPVQVEARLTDSRVEVGNATTLLITVGTDGAAPDRITVPTLPSNLDIVGTSDYTHRQLGLRGGRGALLTRRDIVIVPRAPGVYRIPPVRVEVRGTMYSTAPLNLIVTGEAMTGTNAASRLEVVLERDTVYVGEQVLLYAEATFSEDARMRQSRPPSFDPPAPTGFWIQDLPDPVRVTLRVREGRSVETQTYRRAYFPLRAGEYRLPPARLHYEVRRGFLYAAESRELVSDSARLVVLPLPDEGRPAEYGGAVGSLIMRASVEPRRVAAGQPAVITVELDGMGNIKALPAPVLPDLEHVEIFAPTQESRVTFDGDRVGGLKRFRWMVVPQQPGEIVIPPIEYAVFDPELRTYVVLRSDTLEIDAAVVVAGAPADVTVRGLRRQAGGDRLGWTRAPGFAAAQAVPLLLLAGVVGIRRRRNRPPTLRQRARTARQRLRDLEVGSAADAAVIERTLVSGVLDVLAVDDGGGDAVELLRQAGRAAEADRLRELLDELRRARYEPGATFDAASLIERAAALIAGLAMRGGGTSGRGRWSNSARGGAASAGLVLLPVLLGSALLLAPFAGAAQNVAFGRALDLFERGNVVGAANAFHAYAIAQPRDVNGWYNAGVAAYHAGDTGRAVWAWLRALRLAPRDADVLHNLRVADAQAVARQVGPRDRLSAGERALAAAAAWWLLCGALAVGVFRAGARRRALWTALPAAAALAAVGLAALLAAGRSSIVVPLGDGATLHAAPTIREEAIGVLRPGAWALVLERRDDWLLVRTQTGTDAWAERAAVATP